MNLPIYTVDLGGDVRKNPKLSGTKNNVFGIQTGVSITFFVKVKKPQHKPGIFYYNPFSPFATRVEKLNLLEATSKNWSAVKNIPWQEILPDSTGNWITQSKSDFATLPIELCNKENKALKPHEFNIHGTTLFGLYSLGVVTARDIWVYDKDKQNLEIKIKYFIEIYNSEIERWTKERENQDIDNFVTLKIKWSSSLKPLLISGEKGDFNNSRIRESLYRPFTTMNYYMDLLFSDRLTQNHYEMFPNGQKGENLLICFSGEASNKPFQTLITEYIPSLDLLEKTQCLPLYRYSADGSKQSNLNPNLLTHWGNTLGKPVTPEEAFYYVYAVLHYPTYRQTYALDLTQNLPRIPFLQHDFFTLSTLGKALADLHLHFNTTEKYTNIEIMETPTKKNPQPKLRSDKENNAILVDDNTTLKNIPHNAWNYKLGNRSAIDWVLEGYKEKKISPDYGDIADEHSDLYVKDGYKSYQFEKYKTECIDLLQRIVTVSLETQKLLDDLEKIDFEDQS